MYVGSDQDLRGDLRRTPAGENWTRHIGPGGRSGGTLPERIVIHYTTLHSRSLKRKCWHFDEIFITGCTRSCHSDKFRCSQWWKFSNSPTYSKKTPHSSPEMASYDVSVTVCFRHSVILERDLWQVYMYNNMASRKIRMYLLMKYRRCQTVTCASHRVGAISLSICINMWTISCPIISVICLYITTSCTKSRLEITIEFTYIQPALVALATFWGIIYRNY